MMLCHLIEKSTVYCQSPPALNPLSDPFLGNQPEAFVYPSFVVNKAAISSNLGRRKRLNKS